MAASFDTLTEADLLGGMREKVIKEIRTEAANHDPFPTISVEILEYLAEAIDDPSYILVNIFQRLNVFKNLWSIVHDDTSVFGNGIIRAIFKRLSESSPEFIKDLHNFAHMKHGKEVINDMKKLIDNCEDLICEKIKLERYLESERLINEEELEAVRNMIREMKESILDSAGNPIMRVIIDRLREDLDRASEEIVQREEEIMMAVNKVKLDYMRVSLDDVKERKEKLVIRARNLLDDITRGG